MADALTAQSNCRLTDTIASLTDADIRRECTSLPNLDIGISYSGVLDLPNLLYLEGSLTFGNSSWFQNTVAANLTSISLPHLTNASDISIQSVSGLQSIDIPSISYVAHNLILSRLPDLNKWTGFTALQRANDISIHNTGLKSLLWPKNSIGASISEFFIADNAYMTDISLPGLVNVTGMLSIIGNDATQVMFGIETVRDLILARCGKIFDDAFTALSNVSRTLDLESNSFTSVKFPNIARLGDTVHPSRFEAALSISNNSKLEHVSFPKLTSVQDTAIWVASNGALKIFDGFPMLRDITGLVNFTGNFSRYSSTFSLSRSPPS
jgi:hypothetical protein